MPTTDDLYLAYRQAKIALFFDRTSPGLIHLAKFEDQLQNNLSNLSSILETNGGWFDDLPIGTAWIVPKRLQATSPADPAVSRIGASPKNPQLPNLDIQLRLSPSPECAVVEVLFLWRFGPYLESLLSTNSIGNRLAIRSPPVLRTRRHLFAFWQAQYEQFKTIPINVAARELRQGHSTVVLSADLASFYDTIDPSFLLSDAVLAHLENSAPPNDYPAIDLAEYQHATESLLGFYRSYRALAVRRTGLEWNVGIPIGALTSKLVANLSLATLDRAIEGRAGTLCYRRYVDDFVVVASSTASADYSLDDIIRDRVPHIRKIDDTYHLNVDALDRPGCEFSIQKTKCKAYHLAGPDGLRFLLAIRDDYSRLVSDNRAFLDHSALVASADSDEARPIFRVGAPDRLLTVLRDADRLKLQHFELSTRLRSIERAASLVNTDDAREIAATTLNDVCAFLAIESDWVEQLNLSHRVLRLGFTTANWGASRRLIEYMDSIWGTLASLEGHIQSLFHRDRIIGTRAAWTSLRNYLHARRIEDLCSVIRRQDQISAYPTWLQDGIRDRTQTTSVRALLRRARLLALSDLRTLDREDDTGMPIAAKSRVGHVHLDHYGPHLQRRLALIQRFVDICAKLGDEAWIMPPTAIFLSTRPPSYFDVARRLLYRTEFEGFSDDSFLQLLALVNAIRGTQYTDPIGSVIDDYQIRIPANWHEDEMSENPRIMLGNLVVPHECFSRAATPRKGSITGRPLLTADRLRSVATILREADSISRGSSLLVLPELSIPRRWFRSIATYIAHRALYGLTVGLEYWHDHASGWVYNQAYAVLPGPFRSVATLPWTKRSPARQEALELRKHNVSFNPGLASHRSPRVAVASPYGVFSVLICSELIETRRVADLLHRAELVVVPAWNNDTASFDHLIQSVGLQLHAIVAVANNGHYSDCRAWAPKDVRWQRDLCRLIERGRDGIVSVDIPLLSLRGFHSQGSSARDKEWQRLPPDWSIL